MEKTINPDLAFTAEWKGLDRGTAEERACFSAFGIRHGDVWLTEAKDAFAQGLTNKTYISTYFIAEWVAWNWWRLRWEPRTRAADWPFAHRLATIGHGYVWPNVTIFSDGERVALIAEPTAERPEEPLRYTANYAAIVAAGAFETALDRFMEQVSERLSLTGIAGSNFERIWGEVLAERADPDATQRRKFEALMGADPDKGDIDAVNRLVADARAFGDGAISEIAAERPRDGSVLTAADLRRIAQDDGIQGSTSKMVRLAARTPAPKRAEVAAAHLGARVARLLRDQEHLGADPISDTTLAQMAGVPETILSPGGRGAGISFVLREGAAATRTVLRSKWHEGRRFELARLIGDHIVNPSDKLLPATRSSTYRQKAQRSFAAEFLAPFEEVNARLNGEYDSDEARKDVAEHFKVSELTIRTLLVNHRKLEREHLDSDFDLVA